MRGIIKVLLGSTIAVAMPAGAAVTAIGAAVSADGGDSTGAGCTGDQALSGAPGAIATTCLLGGSAVADAHATLASARSGTLEAGGFSYDAGPGQAYASQANARYSFSVDTTSLFSYSGMLAIVSFANIHGGDEFDFPFDASLLTPLDGRILRAPSGANFADSFLIGPGSYRVSLEGSASGSSDPDTGSGFYYTSGTTFTETLAFTIADAPAVPEPVTWATLIAGLGAAGMVARRRRPAGGPATVRF